MSVEIEELSVRFESGTREPGKTEERGPDLKVLLKRLLSEATDRCLNEVQYRERRARER